MQTDLPYILALNFQKGIGDLTARKIIQFFGYQSFRVDSSADNVRIGVWVKSFVFFKKLK